MSEISVPEALLKALTAASRDGRLALAYSGGLDSRFLAFTAHKVGLTPVLLHVAGPHVAPAETKAALAAAREMGFTVECFDFDPSTVDLAAAGSARCYVCKKALFSRLIARLAEKSPRLPLCDGTNASDLTVFRPGRQALIELGVRSPLAEAGIAKADIRRLGAAWRLPHPEQAARPCLLTRFPYGVTPSLDAFRTVAEVEAFLETLPEAVGLRYRLRYPEGKPSLHVEAASVATNETLALVKAKLFERFPALRPTLTIRTFTKLSGYYDRPDVDFQA